jgi:hypothetical protein
MLSHSSLSKEPIRIDMGSFDYSQFEQRCEYTDKGAPLQLTGMGTQTFDGGGRPMDSDND